MWSICASSSVGLALVRTPPLSTDSQSARDVSYNPEHHDRMKHVQRRHFYVRDMVESFELVVLFVPTKENPADASSPSSCTTRLSSSSIVARS
jgi:hypothetical protein